MINNLINLKSTIINNKFNNSIELKKEFYNSISNIWDDINNLYEDNLNTLYKTQEFLMDEIILIHNKENSEKNIDLLRNNISLRNIIDDLDNAKRGYNIYSFNNDDTEYFLVGDIHSDCISVDRILEKTNFFERMIKKENFKIVFLGDYVDRGKSHLKLIQYILNLKYLFPNNIFIQRGNHDGGSIENGKPKMWVGLPENAIEDDWFLLYLDNLSSKNPSFPKSFISKILKFFDSLAILSFIKQDNTILMTAHGGLPRYKNESSKYYNYLNNISELTNLSIVDNIGKTIVQNIIWSDPVNEDGDLKEDNGRFRFNQGHFNDFKELIGFDFFIRGHQVKEEGFEKTFDNSFITIFSSGSIFENEKNINNETAYEMVSPKIMNFKNGNLNIIDMN